MASIAHSPWTSDRGSRRLRSACLYLLMTAALSPAHAQLGVPGPGPAASVLATSPASRRPLPQLTNSSDARRNMDLDNNAQSNGKVVPQVRIPLGRPAQAPVFENRRPGNGAAGATTGGIDDAAARCESETDARVKAACRDKAGRR